MNHKTTIIGYLNCPDSNAQMKVCYARMRIGIILKYLYMLIFYDYVEVKYETP